MIELTPRGDTMNNANTGKRVDTPVRDGAPRLALETERIAGRWTVISKPGAVIEVREYDLPDQVRDSVSRNLGIGTGAPNTL